MAVEVGQIVEGKVVKIAAFGAFVQLGSGETGLVHISEVANTYVSDINEHLKLGDEVKCKVVSLGEGGRISLSIKKTLPPPERAPRGDRQFGDRSAERSGDRGSRPSGDRRPASRDSGDAARSSGYATPQPQAQAPLSGQDAFEERLSHFMQESKKNLSDSGMFAAKKNRRRGGRG